MIFAKLVPREYRPLLQYITPTAFSVVDWRTALSEFLSNSNFISRDANLKISVEKTNSALANLGITMTRDGNFEKEDFNNGEAILKVYFGQLLLDHGVFLDLRLLRFAQTSEQVQYYPAKIFYRFQDEFKAGLIDLYDGYFLEDRERLKLGMKKTGLWDGKDPLEVQKLATLMFDHFGDALKNPVKLEMSAFGDSFQNLFDYFEQKQVTLPSGFLFLGVYLVTLYLSIDKIGKPYDIRAIYKHVKYSGYSGAT